MSARDPLRGLRALIESEQGLLAQSLRPGDEGVGAFGPLAAAGGRGRSAPDEYGLLVESILEGYLLHYASGRLLESQDADLCLLCGDYLYALGLNRLARLGDLDAVAELADLISICAKVHAGEGDGAPWKLTGGLWSCTALAIGAGGWSAQQDAKRRAREQGEGADSELHAAASVRARELGLTRELQHALIAFDRAVGAGSATT